jgi:two-component SAPR family response regulator
LLFSDVVLPGGMSGMELAEEACRSFPDLKVLFTSGYTRDTAQRWGLADFELLEKPYTKAQLASMLSRALTPECS